MAASLFTSMSTCSVGSSASSFTAKLNTPKACPARLSASPLTIEAAHKKGAGSTKNGRDSRSQRLGVKVYGDQPVKAGGIIVRQRGSEWHPGKNTFLGNDYSLHAKIEGTVQFRKTKNRGNLVDVIPFPEGAKAEKVHTEGPPPWRAKKVAA